MSVEDAAQSIGFKSSTRILAFETGEEHPTRAQLLRLAKLYRRPLLTFYLAEPPRRGDRGQDFRTLPDDQRVTSEAVLDALIRDLRMRQSLVKSTLIDENEQANLAFISSARVEEGVGAVCSAIQRALDFNLESFRGSRTTEQAFSYLRARVEGAGIFVLLVGDLGSHHTAIPIEVFRGFAIADPVAPFVAINDQDAKTAWSFTLLHEVTHLWLGLTGISGARMERTIEQFCNDVSGEILLPRDELRELNIDFASSVDSVIDKIGRFATDRRISRQMVAYKLYRTRQISRSVWISLDNRLRQLWAEERIRQRAGKGKGASGPNYYVVRRHRLGSALLQFVERSVSAATISPVKAARVLGIKPRSLYPLLSDLGGPGASGRSRQ